MRDFPVLWQVASIVFFVYVGAVAALRKSIPARRLALLTAGTGSVIAVVSAVIPRIDWLHGWVVPPALLLLGYWGSGALFRAPMARAEAVLMTTDRRLGIPRHGIPRTVAEILEAAYVGVYPIVAIGFILHLTLTPSPSPDRFWAVVLITDFICFGMLPWIQTRPPRALEQGDPWRSSVRGFNLRLLGATSIHANTFPSGHTAEAIAAALLVLGAPLPVVIGMFAGAAAISAGAVLGRYHYALDAMAGWVVGIVVWLAVS
jgi:membrane-associated phospholipid phosphatase